METRDHTKDRDQNDECDHRNGCAQSCAPPASYQPDGEDDGERLDPFDPSRKEGCNNHENAHRRSSAPNNSG